MQKTRPSLNSEERAVLNAEREALQEMLSTEGWRIFERKVLYEFAGEGYFARMTKAVTGAPTDALVQHKVAEEMRNMLTWPRSRHNELKAVAE